MIKELEKKIEWIGRSKIIRAAQLKTKVTEKDHWNNVKSPEMLTLDLEQIDLNISQLQKQRQFVSEDLKNFLGDAKLAMVAGAITKYYAGVDSWLDKARRV